MHVFEFFTILTINIVVIFVLYKYQKRSIEKNMRHVKEEVQELEDLVAAIIEEFEAVATENEAEKKLEHLIDGQIETDFWTSIEEPVVFEELTRNDDSLITLNSGFPNENDFENHIPATVRHVPIDEPSSKNPELFLANDGNFQYNIFDVSGGNMLGDSPGTTSSGNLAVNTPDVDTPNPVQVPNHSESENLISLEIIHDLKHRRIVELWNHGMTVEEIARQLGKGRGEIQLILGIYKRS